jgi:hypothetical protein
MAAKRKGSKGKFGTVGASPSTSGGTTKSNPAMPTPPKASNRTGDRYAPKGGRGR